ncbi:NAD(P)H-binding protein [Amycolatopsis sp. H6(2020)]|nr:NAD(P)H-binding protein [Amycolatopsis sp. H6(2020)]
MEDLLVAVVGGADHPGTSGPAFASDVEPSPRRSKAVQADIRDHESVHAAVTGHDAVISTIGPAGRKADGLYSAAARTLMSELYGDLRLMEDIVRDSVLDLTFVRPARIVDEPPTGDYHILDGVNPKGGTKISRVDLARFVVDAVSDKRWSCTCPTIAQ